MKPPLALFAFSDAQAQFILIVSVVPQVIACLLQIGGIVAAVSKAAFVDVLMGSFAQPASRVIVVVVGDDLFWPTTTAKESATTETLRLTKTVQKRLHPLKGKCSRRNAGGRCSSGAQKA